MKYLSIAIPLLLLGCFSQDPVKTGLEGKTIPTFSFLLKDSINYIHTNQFPEKPFVLFYFSPNCPHCKNQIENIVNNISSLKDCQFYFISSYSLNEIHTINKKYALSKYSNIELAKDTGFVIADYFKTALVPFTAIYAKNKKLKHTYLGVLSAQQLKDEITN